MNVKLNYTQPEESNPFSSFFDIPKPSEKFWHRPLKQEENLDPQKIVMQAYLSKRVKKGNTFHMRSFKFTSVFFCITQVKKKSENILKEKKCLRTKAPQKFRR